MKLSIGERLREERTRLGLSQTDFAALAGGSKRVQLKWEKDESSPTASALSAFASAGVDVLYILTGNRTVDPQISDDEHITLVLDEAEKDIIQASAVKGGGKNDRKSEALLLDTIVERLQGILDNPAYRGLSIEVRNRAAALIEITRDEKKLMELRAAAFAQKQRAERVNRDGFELWLKNCDYKPNEEVMRHLVDISLEFNVHHEPLVILLQAIYRDLTGPSRR